MCKASSLSSRFVVSKRGLRVFIKGSTPGSYLFIARSSGVDLRLLRVAVAETMLTTLVFTVAFHMAPHRLTSPGRPAIAMCSSAQPLGLQSSFKPLSKSRHVQRPPPRHAVVEAHVLEELDHARRHRLSAHLSRSQ